MQAFSLFVVSLHFIRTYHFKIIPNQTKKLFFHSFFYELLLTKCPWCDIGIYCIPETSERELLILIVFYSIFWIENVMWYCFSIWWIAALMCICVGCIKSKLQTTVCEVTSTVLKSYQMHERIALAIGWLGYSWGFLFYFSFLHLSCRMVSTRDLLNFFR